MKRVEKAEKAVEADHPEHGKHHASHVKHAEEHAKKAKKAKKWVPHLKVGGTLRWNYFVKSWAGQDANRMKLGDIALDTFRINVSGDYGPLKLSGEYRFYAGYSMLHHGWMGYQAGPWMFTFGLQRQPFGLLPYASHSWFFDLGYYLGLEDTYALGLSAHYHQGNLDAWIAGYKNSGGSYTGGSVDSARYSYDLVHASAAEVGGDPGWMNRQNHMVNQASGRIAYDLKYPDGHTTLALSARYGGIYDATTQGMGSQYAVAGSVNAHYKGGNLMLEAARYAFMPDNPAGADNNYVVMGAYDYPYLVASSGTLLIANLSWTFPVHLGVWKSVTVYNDFSYLLKDPAGYAPSGENDLGAAFSVGPMYCYMDFAFGKNHPWLGPEYTSALASGDPLGHWDLRFNVNVAWYF